MKTLVCESWNATVPDCGPTNTVAGESWFNCHMSSLKENEKQKVQYLPVSNTKRFGNGTLFPASQNVNIPIILGHKSVMLNAHIGASDIPLLLSRKSMKKTDMTLDFKNDNAMIFGKSIQLTVTKSGHCAIHVV